MGEDDDRDRGRDARRKAAISLAREEGLIQVIRRSATDSDIRGRYTKAALELSRLLQEAQQEPDTKKGRAARTAWNQACGLGRGPRIQHNRAFHGRWIAEVVDAPDRAAALTKEIRAAGLESRIDELDALLEKHPGPAAAPTKLRVANLPITGRVTKTDCFVALDYIVELAGYEDFGRASRPQAGERIRKIYERARRKRDK